MSVQETRTTTSTVPVPVSGTDIRPVVASRRPPTPVWLFAGGAALAAVALFAVLDGGRRDRTAPSTAPRAADALQTAPALPPLYIETDAPPPAPAPITAPPTGVPPPRPIAPSYAPVGAPFQAPAFAPPTMPPMPQSMPAYAPPTGFSPPQAMPQTMPQAMPYPPQQTASAGSSSPALVIDNTSGGAMTTPPAPGQTAPATMGAAEGAIRAARLTRRATTVPQGTLIPAVLETALDSTRPGHVRAIISRDITGFDGRQVLIPRGSRLFGEYEADLNAGQNRAFVQWTRLVRPDGVTIALASPAADVQGRAGIQGKVNSHFLERFGAAFLQSTLNFGMGLASRSLTGDNGVVVALPGGSQGSGAPTVGGGQIRPTLRVDAGVRVTVFVARDLEFPSSETRR